MGPCSNNHAVEKDPHADLMKKLEHAFEAMNTGLKHFTEGVQALDKSLELVAVAFRELSQGEVPSKLREEVESFGTAVGTRRGTVSTTKRAKVPDNVYTASLFVNDFTKRTNAMITELKRLMTVARQKMKERNDAVGKYNDAQAKAEAIALRDIKKNQNSAEDPKYKEIVKKRDALQIVAETKKRELDAACQTLVTKRASEVEKALHALGDDSFRYWTGLANVVRGVINDTPKFT